MIKKFEFDVDISIFSSVNDSLGVQSDIPETTVFQPAVYGDFMVITKVSKLGKMNVFNIFLELLIVLFSTSPSDFLCGPFQSRPKSCSHRNELKNRSGSKEHCRSLSEFQNETKKM